MPIALTSMITFVAYLTVVIVFGLIAYIATRNLSDYVLGGRSLGGPVAALSAGASDMSSWLLLGLPGLVYATGLRQIWVAIGLTLGAYLCWRLIAKPLRVYSEFANDSVTIPAFLDNRFKDDTKRIRMIAALATLIFFVFYIAAGLYASALLLGRIFGLEYTQALLIGAAIIMFYTTIGGFLAVSWTDFFQGTIMLICLLLIPYFAMESYGGWGAGIDKLLSQQPDYLQVKVPFSEFISDFAWGLGYFGMPHILVRFMSVKTVYEIPIARRICIGWMSLSMLGAILVGMVGAIHFCDCPLDNRETVFMELSTMVFSPWIMGIILATILSSSMCAADSQMLAASSALTEDFYRAIFRRNASQKELVWVGRLTVALIALVAISIAYTPKQNIMQLVSFAWAGLGSTFAAPMILSLFWKRTTRNGIVVGMIVGALTSIVWPALGLDALVYQILPGVVFSFVAIVVISLLDNEPPQAVLEEFEKVKKIVQSTSA